MPKQILKNNETKPKQEQASSFSNKIPLSEDHKELKQFLILSIEKTIETVKETPPCTDLSIAIEEKMKKIYGFDGLAMSRLCAPVFWHLTLDEIKCKDGNVTVLREAPIPTGISKDPKIDKMIWCFRNGAEEKIQNEKEKLADEILELYFEYLRANIEKYNINLNDKK